MFTWKIASKSKGAWNHNGKAEKIADAIKAMKLAFDDCIKENGDIPNDLDWGVKMPNEDQENKVLKPGK